MLADELGYEDVDEFEDALKADFKTFIGALPHIETDNQESELQARSVHRSPYDRVGAVNADP
jgi:hypothetical protein